VDSVAVGSIATHWVIEHKLTRIHRKIRQQRASRRRQVFGVRGRYRHLPETDSTGETPLYSAAVKLSARVDDWFPDVRALLVSREEEPASKLVEYSVFGGSRRSLADDASGGSVSADGAHIAFFRRVD